MVDIKGLYRGVFLYIRNLKTAAFRPRIGNGQSVFRSKKPRHSGRGASFFAAVILAIAFARYSSATEKRPIQFFIKSDEEWITGIDLKVEVYALNSYGLVDREFNGIYPVEVKVKEAGGSVKRSISRLPEELAFEKGIAHFSIRDSEPEEIIISITSGRHSTPFPASVRFRKALVPYGFAIDLPERAGPGERVKGVIYITDEKGREVRGASAEGVRLEARGDIGEGDFLLEPDRVNIENDSAVFFISCKEEGRLSISAVDPRGKLKPASASIEFSPEDTEPPRVTELKMETLAFVELYFNERLDDVSATDTYNYEVICAGSQYPRSVEFHGDMVILELEDLLKPYDVMYIELKGIKDLSGNEIERGTRTPDYSVPYEPMHAELTSSLSSTLAGTSVEIDVVVRCISGRVPQFINADFDITLHESNPDGSAEVSSSRLKMNRGLGRFTVEDEEAETVTITVSDPEGAVEEGSIEIEFI